MIAPALSLNTLLHVLTVDALERLITSVTMTIENDEDAADSNTSLLHGNPVVVRGNAARDGLSTALHQSC